MCQPLAIWKDLNVFGVSSKRDAYNGLFRTLPVSASYTVHAYVETDVTKLVLDIVTQSGSK